MRPVAEWLALDDEGDGRMRPLSLGHRRRRCPAPRARRRAAHRRGAALPHAVASLARAGRHPQLARRTAARAREGGVGGGEAAPDRGTEGRRHPQPAAMRGIAGRRDEARAPLRPWLPRTSAEVPAHSPDEAWIETVALPELQRMPAHQRQDVPLQREQAGVYRRSQGGHISSDRRGRGKLPGIDHPSGQALQSERAGSRRADGARQGVSI